MKLYSLALAIVCVLSAPAISKAEANPLEVVADVSSAVLSFETNRLPKGWFSSGNKFDPTKSTIVVEGRIHAAECSTAQSELIFESGWLGSLTASANTTPNGKNETGYVWSYLADLSQYRNVFSLHTHCDGSLHVHGCDLPREIALTIRVLDKNGAPRTWVDDAGNVKPVEVELRDMWLDALHDVANDAVDTECDEGDSCSIGAEMSACETGCPKGQAGKECRDACGCTVRVQKNRQVPHCFINYIANHCAE